MLGTHELKRPEVHTPLPKNGVCMPKGWTLGKPKAMNEGWGRLCSLCSTEKKGGELPNPILEDRDPYSAHPRVSQDFTASPNVSSEENNDPTFKTQKDDAYQISAKFCAFHP